MEEDELGVEEVLAATVILEQLLSDVIQSRNRTVSSKVQNTVYRMVALFEALHACLFPTYETVNCNNTNMRVDTVIILSILAISM